MSSKKSIKDYKDASVVEETIYAGYGHTNIVFEPINFWAKAGIKIDMYSEMDTLNYIKQGVQKSVLNKTMQAIGFSLEDMAAILHTTDRTLRRYTDKTKLNTEQSERVLELAKLYSYGESVFGDLENFKLWMNSNIQALNNQTPKSFLDTSLGIQLITNCIGRLEHGVYS
jgi:putative toxin-antitoxin system antitoxin component (TIGR02293 family)